jgi:hypothetical protein
LESYALQNLQSLNIHAVGIDLTSVPLDEKEIFGHVETFNAAARKNHLCTFVHGTRSRSLLSGCVAAGFRYLDGSAVAASVMNPLPNKPWTAKDVYTNLI